MATKRPQSKDLNPVIVFRRQIKENLKWKRFQAVLEASWAPQFDKFIEEAQALHRNRTVRHLGAQAHPTGKKVADASMKDQAVRSRCVEIVMEIVRRRNFLAISMNTIETEILSTYNSELIDLGARSINDKKNLVHSLLGPAQKKLDALDTVREVCDLVIDDCDKASFALKHTVEALTVATKRETSY